MRRSSRWLCAFAMALAALLWPAGAAWAHADLESSDPADGSTVDASPAEVTLRFTKAVDLGRAEVVVHDQTAKRVDTGVVRAGTDDRTLVAPLREGLAGGIHVITWRISAADSHPKSGNVTFTLAVPAETQSPSEAQVPAGAAVPSPPEADVVGSDDAAPAAPEALSVLVDEPGTQPWQALETVLRWLMYAATFLAVGGVVFLTLAHDGHPEDRGLLARLLLVTGAVAMVATVGEALFHAAVSTGKGGAIFLSPGVALDALWGSFLLSVGLRISGLGLVVLTARTWMGQRVGIGGVVGAIAVLCSFLFVGHTASTEPRLLVVVSNLIHTTTAATWFGGVVFLVASVRYRRLHEAPVDSAREAAGMADRFAMIAGVTVFLAAAAGTALGWAEIRSVGNLFTSAYGLTLIAKVMLVASIAAIGAYNHFVVIPAVRQGRGPEAWARLRRSVSAEAAGLTTVLAVTAVFVSVAQPT